MPTEIEAGTGFEYGPAVGFGTPLTKEEAEKDSEHMQEAFDSNPAHQLVFTTKETVGTFFLPAYERAAATEGIEGIMKLADAQQMNMFEYCTRVVN